MPFSNHNDTINCKNVACAFSSGCPDGELSDSSSIQATLPLTELLRCVLQREAHFPAASHDGGNEIARERLGRIINEVLMVLDD